MTGIEEIAKERQEHTGKHNWNDKRNSPRQLMQAAIFALTLQPTDYPQGWHHWWFEKMKNKSIKERLKISGSLSAAALDRMKELGVADLQAGDFKHEQSLKEG